MATNSSDLTILISRKEAARLLNISVGTLDRLTRTGQIKHTQIGYRVLYRREVIDEFSRAGEKFWFPLSPEIEQQLQELEREENGEAGETESASSIVN